MPRIRIDDGNYMQFVQAPPGQGMGCVPRNFQTHPVGYCLYAKTFDLPLIPESQWQGLLDARILAKAQFSDIRNRGNGGQPIPSRDQNGKGYCWAHSSVSAMLIRRALSNESYVDLSAYAVACKIKGFRDEGGWGSESLEFIAQNGVPSSQFWPQQSMSRANDNPTTWTNAGLHKFTNWRDLDPDKMKAQLVTCILGNYGPVVSDFNWWSHSVCTVDILSLNPFRTLIWNSWGDSWSENGMGELEGNKAIPDAGLVALESTPSYV